MLRFETYLVKATLSPSDPLPKAACSKPSIPNQDLKKHMGVFQYLFYIHLIYRLVKKKEILPIHRGGRCKQKQSVTASSVSLDSHLQPGTDKEKTQKQIKKDVSFNQKSY